MDMPLGLPLAARGETEFPIDLLISFADVPGLSDAIRRAVNRSPIDYRLDGTVGVDAGRVPIAGVRSADLRQRDHWRRRGAGNRRWSSWTSNESIEVAMGYVAPL